MDFTAAAGRVTVKFGGSVGLFDDGGGLSDFGDFVGKGVQAIGNFFGFNNRASWQNDRGLFKWIDEGVGELTGRNQSRASLNFAKDQQDAAEKGAQELLTQQRWQKQQDDIMASNNARAASTSSDARSAVNYGNSTPLARGPGASPVLGTQKDFLGL